MTAYVLAQHITAPIGDTKNLWTWLGRIAAVWAFEMIGLLP